MSNIRNVEPLGFPWKTQDPFLFCAYHRDEYPQGNSSMGVTPDQLQGRLIGQDFMLKDGWRMYHGKQIPGFPYHPHRGFETITINKEGVVDHSDSLGAAGRFMGGDVQWMTAGKGLQHSEMFPLLNEENPNPLEIFQVWLNLPKASKMVAPHFKMLWKEEIPIIHYQDDSGRQTEIQLIAGSICETQSLTPPPNSWASDSENGVRIFTVKMQARANWTIPKANAGVNRSIFFYKGTSITLDGNHIEVDRLIETEVENDLSITNGVEDSFLFVLEGKPIGERVVQHGPFVMNSEQEIREAINDYNETHFGGWPWTETEVVHSKSEGRFALHSNGIKEVK